MIKEELTTMLQETGRFDTNRFELKQWNYTKISSVAS